MDSSTLLYDWERDVVPADGRVKGALVNLRAETKQNWQVVETETTGILARKRRYSYSLYLEVEPGGALPFHVMLKSASVEATLAYIEGYLCGRKDKRS